MGSGTWTCCAFRDYSHSVGRRVSMSGDVTTTYESATEAYTKTSLCSEMNPRVAKNMMRECRDSDEHPATVPIILALDVTGSMGQTAIEVSKKLNAIVKGVADNIKDAEFMIMGVGDILYDAAPIQYSQFESDVRIAQCLDSIYFEMGGGPNEYESYTAAWYVGLKRTDCDCWKRGRKGLILTIGDEVINPVLHAKQLGSALGVSDIQGDIETRKLYDAVTDKYDVGHIVVKHHYGRDGHYNGCAKSFADVIGKDNVRVTTPDEIASVIVQFITTKCGDGGAFMTTPSLKVDKSDDGTMSVISWA